MTVFRFSSKNIADRWVGALGSVVIGSAVIVLAATMAGCVTDVGGYRMPGADLSNIKTLYINSPGEKPADTDLHARIIGELESKGFIVKAQGEELVLGETDALVNYGVDWNWDITTYLYDLRISIYEPQNRTLLTEGHSRQSSTTRKKVQEVVERTVAAMLAPPE